MNFRFKFLAVFLSAGILLNSTSMTFAEQNSVGAVLGNRFFYYTEDKEPINFDLNIRKGGRILAGTELSAEQCKGELEGNITWTLDRETGTLYIYGNGYDMIEYDADIRKPHAVRPRWEEVFRILRIDISTIKRVRIENTINFPKGLFEYPTTIYAASVEYSPASNFNRK